METLRFGSRGTEISNLQHKLVVMGYYTTRVDGIYGNNTVAAVKKFQSDNGISTDGVYGPTTYKYMNKYKFYSLKNGDKNITKNFALHEFACKDGNPLLVIDEEFIITKLQMIRDHFGKPIRINSGYRTLSHNSKPSVGGSKNSLHLRGRAFDIYVKGVSQNEVAKYAVSIGIPGVIRYNGFVHIDSRCKTYRAINNNGKVTVVNGF